MKQIFRSKNMYIKSNPIKLYKNSMSRVIYSMLCLLLIGLLSCGTTDEGGTAPSVNYDSLGISSFSVVNGNDVPINDTNAIPVDTSFLLTFDQSLGNMDSYVNSLTSQIELLNMGGGGGGQSHYFKG